jgi:hypothetical protein
MSSSDRKRKSADLTPPIAIHTTNTEAGAHDETNDEPPEFAKLRKQGIHPVTKLMVRTCACSNPKECRGIMWKWAGLGKEEMFPYLRLPGYPKKNKTTNAKHAIGFRENVCRHLYGDLIQSS